MNNYTEIPTNDPDENTVNISTQTNVIVRTPTPNEERKTNFSNACGTCLMFSLLTILFPEPTVTCYNFSNAFCCALIAFQPIRTVSDECATLTIKCLDF